VSRDRDQQLDQALKQELRAMSMPAGEHIDPETLAAWADGGLDTTAMLSVESHVSSCPRCQAIAGVMAHSAPVVVPEPRGLFRIPAWWIPIAAGAAAVTIWMVVPQQREIATAPPTVPARAAESAPVPVPVPAPAAPLTAAKDATAPRQDKELTTRREDRRERAAVAENKAQESVGKLQDAAGAVAAAPPGASPVPALQQTLRMAPAPPEIASPDGSRRWRIVASGIERSEDSGRSWTLIRTAAGDVITSGVAPTASICWLIGRSGIVLVSADGSTFTRVPLPETIDLSAIAATDARNAVVTTVDGRRFRTDDSGRTWRQN
jgi:hypothetical protein